ncbi:NAD-dependent epimerase/dehydratase family protein [Microbacterium sp. MC2]
MDVVISGAGGRMGSHVARLLLGEGHRVRALDIAPSHTLGELEAQGALVFLGGLDDRDTLARACDGVDAVVHPGAVLSSHGRPDDLVIQANFVGTYNLLVAARDHAPGLKRFVYVSSDAVYWRTATAGSPVLPVTEQFSRVAGTVYGATKVGAEQLCTAFLASYGMPTTVARPTMTVVPSELIDPDSAFGRRWFVGGARRWWRSRPALSPLEADFVRILDESGADDDDLFLVVRPDGQPSVTMLNDARDVAQGLRLMIDAPEAVGQAFNLGSFDISERTLVEAIAAQLGRRMHTFAHPIARPSWYVSSQKAQQAFGYHPVHDPLGMVAEAMETRFDGGDR